MILSAACARLAQAELCVKHFLVEFLIIFYHL
nr:MAG TPA: hypothetical protein [Caudoviricetes sp.]